MTNEQIEDKANESPLKKVIENIIIGMLGVAIGAVIIFFPMVIAHYFGSGWLWLYSIHSIYVLYMLGESINKENQ